MAFDTLSGSEMRFRDLPTFRLHRLAGASERMAEAEYQALFGLSVSECRVIGVTGARPRTAFRELCAEAELEKAYASRLVTRLTERGLIAKVGDPADQRATILTLTGAGRRLYRDILAAARRRNHGWLSVLTDAQRAAFLEALDLLQARTRPETGGGAAPPAPDPAPPPGEVRIDAALARQLRDALAAALAPVPGEKG